MKFHLVFLLFFAQILFAQKSKSPFIFENFVDNSGTLSNIISCFFEDKDGFLWIGTPNGLKRFDGNNFNYFKHENGNINSLPHFLVNGICEDKLGHIWVGTAEGVGYFDKKTSQFVNIAETNKSDNVCFSIISDHNGDIWFTIREKGLYKYSIDSKSLTNYFYDKNDKFSLNDNGIDRHGMFLDPSKKGIWILTDQGLNFFDFSSNQFQNRNNSKKTIFQYRNITGFGIAGSQLIFFNYDSQALTVYDLLSEKIITEYPLGYRPEKTRVNFIFADKLNNLWITDWYNFSYFFDQKTHLFKALINDPSNPNTIASNAFWSAYQHKNGGVWLGTNSGISMTNTNQNIFEIHEIDKFFKKENKGNQLYLFKEDSKDSSWWMAKNKDEFINYKTDNQAIETYKIVEKRKNPFPKILAFIENENSIYIANTGSLKLFDKKHKTISEIPLPYVLNNENRLSHATQLGDSIWLFSENLTAYSYKISTEKWRKYPILIKKGEEVICSEVDNAGHIWLGIFSTGLAKFSKEKQAFELVNIKNFIPYKKLRYSDLRKDTEGNLWVGSPYNLVKINPATNTYLEAREFGIISGLLLDKKQNIWTQSYNDFSIFNLKTEKTLNGTMPISNVNLNLLWKNSLHLLKNGQIVSLVNNTVVKIDPNKFNTKSKNGHVLINSIALTNREILLYNGNKKIELASFDNGFNIQFSVLNVPGINNLKYLYQLVGFNKDWVPANGNKAYFSNLDGGEYVFKVKGIDTNGIETQISSISLNIATVFYKTKWFLSLLAILLVALGYFIYKYRTSQTARFHQLQLITNRLEKDKSEIQYQNLINHLNPHFLFNSLSSLSSLIESENKEVANKFLDNLSKIYRYILKSRESETVPLMNELKFTENYIRLQKTRFTIGFQVNIKIIDEYNYSKIVPVTIQNLIENAIKHNIIDEESPLIIDIFIEDDYLVVSNNFQPKKFVDTSNQQGLESMKSLYKYLTDKELLIKKTEKNFSVYIPLI